MRTTSIRIVICVMAGANLLSYLLLGSALYGLKHFTGIAYFSDFGYLENKAKISTVLHVAANYLSIVAVVLAFTLRQHGRPQAFVPYASAPTAFSPPTAPTPPGIGR
ncbi:unannotated protein [freshwater metagenome]|uniref:Unannotated protein n=1 Tax=freshwater metagenome TaxID=449393 RepID=A0A6J7EX76_9ZZZZ|nr:hypothetical protein [Actinomycetota bacterium]